MEQPWGRGRAACWSDPQHHPGLAKPFPVRAVCQGSWVWLWGCRGPSQGMKLKIWDSDVCVGWAQPPSRASHGIHSEERSWWNTANGVMGAGPRLGSELAEVVHPQRKPALVVSLE